MNSSYILKKFNVKAFTMTEVQNLGIKKVVQESLNHLTIKYKRLFSILINI